MSLTPNASIISEKVLNNVHLKRSLGFIDSVCGSGASASLLGQLGLFVREKTAHHEGRDTSYLGLTVNFTK